MTSPHTLWKNITQETIFHASCLHLSISRVKLSLDMGYRPSPQLQRSLWYACACLTLQSSSHPDHRLHCPLLLSSGCIANLIRMDSALEAAFRAQAQAYLEAAMTVYRSIAPSGQQANTLIINIINDDVTELSVGCIVIHDEPFVELEVWQQEFYAAMLLASETHLIQNNQDGVLCIFTWSELSEILDWEVHNSHAEWEYMCGCASSLY